MPDPAAIRIESFIVERYLPGASPEQLHDIVERLARERFDPPTRYRGSIVIPGDESCLCLFDAVDADTVRQVNDALRLPVARVTPVELSLGAVPPERHVVPGPPDVHVPQ
jgi:hypothetical protein